jgi:hypothetical protein
MKPKKPDGSEIHRSVDKIVAGILGLLRADPSLNTRKKVEQIARGLVHFAWAARKKRVCGTDNFERGSR